MQGRHALTEVVGPTLISPEWRAGLGQCEQVGDQRTTLRWRAQGGGSQAWGGAEAEHRAAKSGDRRSIVERAEASKQVACLAHGAGRRRVQPGQVVTAPAG